MKIAYLLLLLSAGCSGIQFGDGNDEVGEAPCDIQREQALSDLNAIPPGFSEAPEKALASADGFYSGTLTLESGEVLPISLTLALNRQSVRAHYTETSAGKSCRTPTLTANVDLTLDGGATLSGVGGGQVDTEWLLISASIAAEALMTTLMPNYTSTPIGPPGLQVLLGLNPDRLSGGFMWSIACSAQTCPGIKNATLGDVDVLRVAGP